MYPNTERFLRLVRVAQSLRAEPEHRNDEYERGMAELIVYSTPGLTSDHVADVTKLIRGER